MKYIKKVSVSDLQTSTGTIIDSMNPGDDQTVNAPSIHAVKDYAFDKKLIYVRRNLQVTFNNGTASIDISSMGFDDKNYIGFASFPYNNIYDVRLQADTSTSATIDAIGTSNSTYYVNVLIVHI